MSRLEWEELARSSLKTQILERVLNRSTLEGVDLKGLYDSREAVLELFSFPSDFVSSVIYDCSLVDGEGLAKEREEGVQSHLLVATNHAWKKNIPFERMLGAGHQARLLAQKADDAFLEEVLAKVPAAHVLVDTHHLAFCSFDKEVARVDAKGAGFAINMSRVHNAGASMAQEISYGLNIFHRLLKLGIDPQKIIFLCAVDSVFFMNISKLRALRYLAEELLAASGLEPRPRIHSVSSLREQTLYDPWTNILRNCASSMAAALGGADEIAIRPHDAAYSALTGEPSSEQARRAARHTLNIIKEESKLSFVADSAKGSFAVEEISAELAQQAWQHFLSWEEQDLFLHLNDFAKSVEALSKARRERVGKRLKVVTGINDFANPDETLQSLYNRPWRPVDIMTGLFPLRRLSIDFEEARSALEKSDAKLKACLLYKGKLSALSARINFVKNIFETLGIPVIELEAQEDLNAPLEKAAKEGCNILALVAKDEDYAGWARPADRKVFKSQFIAGNPDNIELESKEEFVDLRMGKNIYQVLEEMLKTEGVEL